MLELHEVEEGSVYKDCQCTPGEMITKFPNSNNKQVEIHLDSPYGMHSGSQNSFQYKSLSSTLPTGKNDSMVLVEHTRTIRWVRFFLLQCFLHETISSKFRKYKILFKIRNDCLWLKNCLESKYTCHGKAYLEMIDLASAFCNYKITELTQLSKNGSEWALYTQEDW
jgi:hypothetical protein